MRATVCSTATSWEGADGTTTDLVIDGSALSADVRLRALDALKRPVRRTESFILQADGTRHPLSFIGDSYILPDRTGIVAIFDAGQYTKADGTDCFPYPNNAAIFNADGRLRFQLQLNDGHRIATFHTGWMPPKFEGMMGVLMATHADAPPEWVYAIDPSSPVLIPTGQWVRY